MDARDMLAYLEQSYGPCVTAGLLLLLFAAVVVLADLALGDPLGGGR